MNNSEEQGLVVGHYTHDILLRDGFTITHSLGGATSFISNIFPSFSISCNYISKVGPDFIYPVITPPIIVPSSKTTLFHAHFMTRSTPDRTLKRVTACDPIEPLELGLPGSGLKYRFGMAVGVAGEILPETLAKMVDICGIVFVDVQGLIRKFDENDGSVSLVDVSETGFKGLLSRIGVLKASKEEAEFIDVEEVRKVSCVVVTDGDDGCRVYWKDGEVKIAAFKTVQVDPTGAGDSLLGGFVAGVVYGLAVPDAALLGNFFGALTVGQIGLPKFDPKLLQRVKDEVQKRVLQCAKHRAGDEKELWFSKPPGHDEFYASLNAARQAYTSSEREIENGLPNLYDHATRLINPCSNHLSNGQTLLHDPVYDEPIQSVEGTP